RGEIATALWRAGAVLSRLEDDRIAGPHELFVEPAELTLFTGDLTDEWRAVLSRLGPRALVATPAQAVRRPALLAELGAELLRRGEVDDVATLAPIYLRPPHITAPRRGRAVRRPADAARGRRRGVARRARVLHHPLAGQRVPARAAREPAEPLRRHPLGRAARPRWWGAARSRARARAAARRRAARRHVVAPPARARRAGRRAADRAGRHPRLRRHVVDVRRGAHHDDRRAPGAARPRPWRADVGPSDRAGAGDGRQTANARSPCVEPRRPGALPEVLVPGGGRPEALLQR